MNLLLSLIFFSPFLFATNIQGSYNKCSDQSQQALFDKFSKFESYHEIDKDGFKYFKLTKKISLNVMDMIDSKVIKEIKKDSVTTTILYIRLRPLPNQTTLAAKMYPRFHLLCKSNMKALTLSCNLVKKLPHYALDDFNLEVKLSENDSTCKKRDLSKIEITYKADINDQDYEEIKAESADQMNFPQVIVDRLFNARSFFEKYWKNFFEEWQKS